MKPIFLDTVGLIAVWDESDQWHEAAEVVYSEALRRKRPLVTTT